MKIENVYIKWQINKKTCCRVLCYLLRNLSLIKSYSWHYFLFFLRLWHSLKLFLAVALKSTTVLARKLFSNSSINLQLVFLQWPLVSLAWPQIFRNEALLIGCQVRSKFYPHPISTWNKLARRTWRSLAAHSPQQWRSAVVSVTNHDVIVPTELFVLYVKFFELQTDDVTWASC